MGEIISFGIGALAILAALLAIPGFTVVRWSIIFAGLAGGQVYLSVAAFGIMLVVENRFTIRAALPRYVYFFLIFGFATIIGLTLLSPVNLRTFSELVQLALYLLLFILLTSCLRNGHDILQVLRGAVFGTLATAVLGLSINILGYASGADVFVGRGFNEGATFMSLIGVVSCTVMFSRSRNPLYIVAALFLVYMQYLATSRGGMAVSALVILIGFFFQFRNVAIRGVMALAGVYILFRSVPILRNLVEGQVNFSARERLALVEHGWYLFLDRIWTGHGWGSTDTLAATAPTTRNAYPHFHNTYIQMIVELGVFGWIILAAFLFFAIAACWIAITKVRQPAVSTLVFAGFIAIMIAANFDALLFGADRSVQIVILCALISRSLILGGEFARGKDKQPVQAGLPQARLAQGNPAILVQR